MIFWLNRVFRWVRMAFQTVQNARNQWAPEIKRLNDNLEKLEGSLAGTDDCVLDIYSLEEGLQDKITILEEDLADVKAENVEMRKHFNSMIKQLNGLTAYVNEKYGYKIFEETSELDTAPPNKGYSLRSYKT